MKKGKAKRAIKKKNYSKLYATVAMLIFVVIIISSFFQIQNNGSINPFAVLGINRASPYPYPSPTYGAPIGSPSTGIRNPAYPSSPTSAYPVPTGTTSPSPSASPIAPLPVPSKSPTATPTTTPTTSPTTIPTTTPTTSPTEIPSPVPSKTTSPIPESTSEEPPTQPSNPSNPTNPSETNPETRESPNPATTPETTPKTTFQCNIGICDDSNTCTDDSCDKDKGDSRGCYHKDKPNGDPCNSASLNSASIWSYIGNLFTIKGSTSGYVGGVCENGVCVIKGECFGKKVGAPCGDLWGLFSRCHDDGKCY